MIEFLKLALRRSHSADDYRKFQSFIAERAVHEIQERGVDLKDKRVLELGSGHGGYSLALRDAACLFLASDVVEDEVYGKERIPFRKIDVSRPFPLDAGSFDFVYCSSLIEHIAAPRFMLQEVNRVLASDGFLYLSFPPFYSLLLAGGHQFKPFHLFGETFALKLYNLLHRTNVKKFSEAGGCGLYPLTIDQVGKLLEKSGFKILDIYGRMWSAKSARRPGILKDWFTWHVCFLARKK